MTMSNHLWFLIPEAILLVGVVFTAITGLMRSSTIRRSTPAVAGLFVAASGVASAYVFNPECLESTTFLMPGLGRWIGVVTACAIGLAVDPGRRSVSVDRKPGDRPMAAMVELRFDPLRAGRGEYYAFMLLSLAGLMLVCTANDLIWLFLALELTSLPTYVHGGDESQQSTRPGSSNEVLLPWSHVRGDLPLRVSPCCTRRPGRSSSTDMRVGSCRPRRPMAGLGVPWRLAGLLLVTVRNRVTSWLRPHLHLYAADVYEGASAPVTAFLGFVPKAAGARWQS